MRYREDRQRRIGSLSLVMGVLSGLLACSVFRVTAASAQTADDIAAAVAAPAAASMSVSLLDKAQPDECFVSIGSPNNLFPATPPCASGVPKVNGAYIWGMASSGKNIWYGTIANTLCTVMAGVLTAGGLPLDPIQTDSYVCEFSKSNFLKSNPTVPPALGDWRPPKIFSFNRATGIVTDRTPNDPLINQTLGIRSAGARGNLIILAGPALAPFGTLAPGINLFAFQNSTGKYLGSTTLTQYSDIRSWVNASLPTQTVDPSVLYTGVQNRDGTGSVLRWTGTVKNPFQFVVVGNIDNEPAYLAAFGNRVFATTWGGINSPTHKLSGLWVSPPSRLAGLTPASVNSWSEIWRTDQYEIDPVTAQTLVGGALVGFHGQLYWGTMQVPMTGALAHYVAYPPSGKITPSDLAAAIVNTTRPVAIFRLNMSARPYKTPVPIQLLYGDTLMEVYSPSTGWQVRPNAMNVQPTFGPAGFGNPFNTYAWSAAAMKGKVFFGTFDWSFVAVDSLDALLSEIGLNPGDISIIVPQIIQVLNPNALNYGADLWALDVATGSATAESQYGVGNYLNYGIRTMLVVGGQLYLGAANPMNLRTDKNNPPLGGYELLGLH